MCSTGWLETHYINKLSFKLTETRYHGKPLRSTCFNITAHRYTLLFIIVDTKVQHIILYLLMKMLIQQSCPGTKDRRNICASYHQQCFDLIPKIGIKSTFKTKRLQNASFSYTVFLQIMPFKGNQFSCKQPVFHVTEF